MGVRRGELEGGRQGADHVRTLRETGHDPVDGQDLEVLFGQLDHKTQQGVVAFQRSGGDGAVTALLRLVGEGRLVAVVTIGHQERARRDHLRHGLMNARRDDGPELVEGAIVISGTGIIGGTGIVGGTGGAGAGLSRRLWPVRGVPAIWDGPWAWARPGSEHRHQMGEVLQRVALMSSKRSLLALGVVCSWGRMPCPGGSSTSAPITPSV